MASRARTRCAALFALAGCGSSGARTAAIDTTSESKNPTCRTHQIVMPSEDYTGGSDSKPLAVLAMMKYNAFKGTRPFCDTKPATAQDTAWSRLYAGLTNT